MEKITIKSITPKVTKGGVPFWACEAANGSKYTLWDAVIAGVIGANLNLECEAELKQSGDFWNIRAFNPSNITPTAEKVNNAVIPPTSNIVTHSIKDTSIISQCLTKCATEIICTDSYMNMEGALGQNLCEVMNELVGCYKLGLKLLNE